MTRLRLISLLSTLIFFALATAVFPAAPKEVSVEAEQVEYTLPYPGILPDNPLFFIKNIRDSFWGFLTRDYHKKAELMLLFSDKRVAMASELSEKGKWELAADSLEQSESDFKKAISAVAQAKKQGNGPPGDFVQTLKLSNAKHRQVIETLLKETPQGSGTNLQTTLERNKKLSQELSRL